MVVEFSVMDDAFGFLALGLPGSSGK